VNAAFTVTGWLDLVATVLLAGGLVFAAAVATPAEAGRRTMRVAADALAPVLVASFALVGIRMHEVAGGEGVGFVGRLLAMHWGRYWIGRAAGLVVLRVGLAAARPRWTLLAVFAVPWLLLRSSQGHAGAHGTVPALVDWAHLAGAAAWLGGLAQMALLADDVPAAARLRRLATAALALVVPAGVYAAFLHVPSLDRLLHTPYGQTLLAKLALVAVLLTLGAANHFRHVPALVAGDAVAAVRLRRTVRMELVLAAVILLLSALLGVLPMPHEPPS
jgi:putative copper export protein